MSGQEVTSWGDEGSGAVLGKMFLSDVLKGLAPKDVTADFFEKFRISPNEVMESVYNRPFPNRFLSTISYFLADYTNDDYVFELITGNLRNFFTRNVCQYDYKIILFVLWVHWLTATRPFCGKLPVNLASNWKSLKKHQ